MNFAIRRFANHIALGLMGLLFCFVATDVHAQLQVDFTRAPDDAPLQAGWLPFQGDGTATITQTFDLDGKTIDVTIGGNTHWRDYAPATGVFAGLSDLLRDGVLCNDTCDMTLRLENLADGSYELVAFTHTTQFGPQDGRPFTPFEIRLSDAEVNDLVINSEALMSDNGSGDLSTQSIPFTVAGGSAVEIVFAKPSGSDHLQLAGITLVPEPTGIVILLLGLLALFPAARRGNHIRQ